MNRPQFSPLFRLWHWLTAFSVLGLFATVALRSTFLDKKANAQIILDKLASFSVSIDQEQAVAVAKAIRAPMWEWHYILGFLLAAAVALRIFLILRGQAQMPLLKLLQAQGLHEKGKAAIHLLICLGILVMTATGLFYYFFDSESFHWVKEIHESLLWPMVILVLLHIGGVLMHELSTKECIVSKMIHGDEEA
ncbi:cytochrome b/b6 domain-containing protein [Nitratifractor sp.]